MTYDPARLIMEAEISLMTDLRQEELSEELVAELTESADAEPASAEHGLARTTHRCLTFRN